MPERSSPTASRRITPRSVTSQDSLPSSRAAAGRVIAVYGARSNVGVTTVARALTRAFLALGSENVAHCELDPRVVRARSDGSTGGNHTERIAIPGLNAALVPHSDGVWTLAMTRPRTPAVGDAKGVMVALEAVRGRFPVSIAELEHQVNERTLAALDAADRIVLVTEGAVPSLRGTQRVLRLCRRLNYPDEKMCVVVNRFDAPESLSLTDIAVALKREIFWKIGSGETELTGLAEKLLGTELGTGD